jgi:hypothetical protein
MYIYESFRRAYLGSGFETGSSVTVHQILESKSDKSFILSIKCILS